MAWLLAVTRSTRFLAGDLRAGERAPPVPGGGAVPREVLVFLTGGAKIGL